ncbi:MULTISPECIES: hypothetical protein [unclassified Lentimonas]|uniref:hypothetical protein n=1 Tax=unclassified Lentimonas TaxID=2630993 RepID=UPI00132ADF1D|nr:MULTISPECIES: hypothetical protein [unclassified Lentimonas]CAA6676983.1 Unannotated [Lentimonas sp. CC4]CAA6686789.1 Unannotated [Lentimonas sp. CC6]CAA7075633.1 Unannotated [Lentimonas sp. CC4]CAA7168209.1 Unannotated [Lentimonas sp. CC21]CAA7181640.1 Unannotated [Lentimonas sp. CC8]
MNQVTSSVISLLCAASQLFGTECIQVEDVQYGSSQLLELAANQGSFADTHEFYIGAPSADQSTKMYAGYKLTYVKREGQLVITVISNAFEGFFEIDEGEFSSIDDSRPQKT